MQINTMASLSKGAHLEQWSYETPSLGPHDCLLRVVACGICHSDIHMIDNDWAMSKYPIVPGHEAVGEVIESGSQVRLKAGTRVGVGWQRSACLECADCLTGSENLCNHSKMVIGDGYGGFADHLVMDSRFCFPLSEGLPNDTTGPLLCGGITVYSALRHAGMSSGQHIGVIGIGGLGHMAVQFAAKLGNQVTVFTSSEDKAQVAAQFGAHDAVISKGGEAPQVKRPLDILLNTAPANLNWAHYLNLLDTDGVMSFVGMPNEPLVIPAGLLMFKRRRVMGSIIGGRGTIQEMLHIADRFEVAPLIETFPLHEANQALQKVRDNTIRYRAVLQVAP